MSFPTWIKLWLFSFFSLCYSSISILCVNVSFWISHLLVLWNVTWSASCGDRSLLGEDNGRTQTVETQNWLQNRENREWLMETDTKDGSPRNTLIRVIFASPTKINSVFFVFNLQKILQFSKRKQTFPKSLLGWRSAFEFYKECDISKDQNREQVNTKPSRKIQPNWVMCYS